MLTASCGKCGAVYYGCALRYVTELNCLKCGSSLVISYINAATKPEHSDDSKSSTEPAYDLSRGVS
jgi:hypothetical protein